MSVSKSATPLVTFAFPIHKKNLYYLKALESIESQTYPHIEILIIDSSVEGIVFSKSKRFPSKIIRVPSHYGLSESLNVALQNARGKYLARLDYDDLCLPERISKQVDFLERNPDVSLLGTAAYIIKENDEHLSQSQVLKHPLTNNDILLNMLYKNSLLHPTVMLRLDTFREFRLFYRRKYDGAEDYDLWLRASRKIKLVNLDIPLVAIRHHDHQFSRVDRGRGEFLSYKLRLRHLVWMAMKGHLSCYKILIVLRVIFSGFVHSSKKNITRGSINKFDK